MAGTRLLLQTVSVIQLFSLALWSAYYGLCRNNDTLCTNLWELIVPPSLPCVPTVQLPAAQVSAALSSSPKISWESNAEAEKVCQQQTPITDHPVWLCQGSNEAPRVVNRDSSLIIYYNSEKDLESTLFPKVEPPKVFHVHLFLEKHPSAVPDVTDSSEQWMSAVDRWMTSQANFLNERGATNSNYWPCLEDIQVNVRFVTSSTTSQWTKITNPEETQDMESNSTTEIELEPSLARPTKTQVESLLSQLPSVEDALGLVIYVPAVLPRETYTWKTEEQLLILPSSSESLADFLPSVGRWLPSLLMGVPETLDSDGTFPSWYADHYHHFLINHHRQHVVAVGGGECTSISTSDDEDPLIQLQTLLAQQRGSLEQHFPFEHYAAIFAPLLFPLLIPLLAGVVRERNRYKEKTTAKAAPPVEDAAATE